MSTCTEYRVGGTDGDSVAVVDGSSPGNLMQGARAIKPNILVYRNDLLQRSETFILAQASALQRYRAIFCGMSQKPDGILPEEAPRSLLLKSDHHTVLENVLRKRAYMAAGFAPGWGRRCRGAHPALLHAHFGLDGAFALPLQASLKVPLIVSLHGYDVTTADDELRRSAGGRLYLKRRKTLFQRADLFICVSRFILEQAIGRGYPAEKLWVHSIGIDTASFQADESVQREPIVLFVGRLVEKKGCTHLIAAMRTVQHAMPATRLVMIGEGPLRQTLEQQASQSLPGNYLFLGAQPASVVHSWLQRASVFSVPSVTAANGDREGLGMVFCEAQAMGVPVVSFASGGIGEAVLDGTTGFLRPEGDHVGLAQSICRLLKDRALWLEMSTQGRMRIEQHFNLQHQTVLLESKYDEVIAASRGNQLRIDI